MRFRVMALNFQEKNVTFIQYTWVKKLGEMNFKSLILKFIWKEQMCKNVL